MLNYILRRLVLMIPTLIGITFLVFMIVAMSPGGVGAALKQQAGARQSATQVAVQEAYLDDRYGLDDPAPIQYLRWLGRVSPLKFGTRAQINPAGERIYPPKPVKDPAMWQWFTDTHPPAGDFTESERADVAALTGDALVDAYKAADRRYADVRSDFIADNARLKEALGRYGQEKRIPNIVDRDAKVRLAALKHHLPDKTSPQWASMQELAGKAFASYHAATREQARFKAIFDRRPYDQAGFAIIPGVLSIAAPDWGTAFSRNQPVMDLILEALPVTILLNLIAFPIIYSIAIPSGMLAAWKRGTWVDSGLGMLYILLYSFPVLLAGVLLVGFMANNQYLGWFPASDLHANAAADMAFLPGTIEVPGLDGASVRVWQRGWLLDLIWHVCLPVLCLVYGGFAILSKQTRAAMLENFSSDYVRTAKAKGVATKDVILKHVFRNSLLPLITIFVTIFPAMLAGSVVVERIFNVHGMGWLVIEATSLRDRELLLANTLIIAGVNLLALLLADILYAVADPRIAYR